MAKERIYTERRERDSDGSHDISIQWERGQPEVAPVGEDAYGYVTLSLVQRTEDAPTAYCHLTRQQINQLVRVLRRARGVAFEVDE